MIEGKINKLKIRLIEIKYSKQNDQNINQKQVEWQYYF